MEAFRQAVEKNRSAISYRWLLLLLLFSGLILADLTFLTRDLGYV